MSGLSNYSTSQEHQQSTWFNTPTHSGTSAPNYTNWADPWPGDSYPVSMSVNAAVPLNEKPVRTASFSPTPHSNDMMPLLQAQKKTSPCSSSSASPYGSIDNIRKPDRSSPLKSPVNNTIDHSISLPDSGDLVSFSINKYESVCIDRSNLLVLC